MAKNNMEGSDIRMTLRLPEYLHSALNTDAKNQERSLNNQIVFALKQMYPNAEKDFGKTNDKKASASE